MNSNVAYITQDYYTLEKIIAVSFAPFPALPGIFLVAIGAIIHSCATEVVVVLTLYSAVQSVADKETT